MSDGFVPFAVRCILFGDEVELHFALDCRFVLTVPMNALVLNEALEGVFGIKLPILLRISIIWVIRNLLWLKLVRIYQRQMHDML